MFHTKYIHETNVKTTSKNCDVDIVITNEFIKTKNVNINDLSNNSYINSQKRDK